MMRSEYTAVVLRRYTHTCYKIALLDQNIGRIEAVVRDANKFVVGALIHYSVKRQFEHTHFIDHWELKDIPFSLAQSDLLFLHHVLELCYYFIPIGAGAQGVFEVINFLYDLRLASCGRSVKKILLLRLLMIIGLHPEVPAADMRHIQKLYARSVDMKLDEDIDLADEKRLDAWLIACILQHPHHELFQTINFLIHDR